MLLALVIGGCDGADPGSTCGPRSLVDHHAWALVPFEEDPFARGAPGDRSPVPCAEVDQGYEVFGAEDSWGISTQRCDWATLAQPAVTSARAGAEATVRVWYFSQTPAEPAEARLALLADGVPFWTDTLPLPAPQGGLSWATFPLPVPVEAGALLHFHLDNHGQNSWNLLEVSVDDPAACDGG